jgi:hypothetical protein
MVESLPFSQISKIERRWAEKKIEDFEKYLCYSLIDDNVHFHVDFSHDSMLFH